MDLVRNGHLHVKIQSALPTSLPSFSSHRQKLVTHMI